MCAMYMGVNEIDIWPSAASGWWKLNIQRRAIIKSAKCVSVERLRMKQKSCASLTCDESRVIDMKVHVSSMASLRMYELAHFA